MGKSVLGSKLSWLGILTAVVSAAEALGASDLIAQFPQAAAWTGVVVGIGTTLLRVFGTSKPIQSVLPK
jgi:hypothetical protein